MALKLWMGPSGSGKTHFLFEYVLKEAREHMDVNYIVVVPEQFTLSTQRQLIRQSENHGILNVDVLSFARLAYRIFEEVGFKDASGQNIDDMDKNLIIRHITMNLDADDRLTALAGNMDKLGYITEVKSMISEFMQYGIGPDKLVQLSDEAKKAGRTRLAHKLHDVEVIYRLFEQYIDEKFITKEEILSKASRAAYKSKKLKKSVVVFDGYTGFTPVQYNLIESLMMISRDIHVTILTDTRDNITYNTEHELFYYGYKTEKKLRELAELNNIKVDNAIEIKEDVPRRYIAKNDSNDSVEHTNDMLVHLEKNLFREYQKPYKGENSVTGDMKKPTKAVNAGIRVFSGLQPIEEVTKVAMFIQDIVRNDSKICYKDIAVATGDLESYMPVIKRVFSEYEIPYFFDKTLPVMLNPLIEYVRALADIVIDNFSYSAVFRYLRSPMAGFITGDIDRIENFVLKNGIAGYDKWNVDWKEKYGCYSKNAQEYDLDDVENLRKKIVNNLEFISNLITLMHEKGGKLPTIAVNEINAVFMRGIEADKVQKQLDLILDRAKETDVPFYNDHKKEYEKVYEQVIRVMVRMEELLEGDEITFPEYAELLDAGFEEIRIGVIPNSSDFVQIGDTTRSRFENVHTLFIVGANDGVIPQNTSANGIITDIEKEFLFEVSPDIELAPTSREKAFAGQLYLYMLMTKPKYKLFVSYSRMNDNNESINPSYIIKVITDMFPMIEIEHDDASPWEKIYNVNSGLDILAENIKEPLYRGLIKLFEAGGQSGTEYRSLILKIIDAAYMDGVLNASDSISRAVASVLYGKAVIGSVSNLEQYAQCSFSYFLEYGLSLKEREIFTFEARDMGTVFHSVLEKYSGYVKKIGVSWEEVEDEDKDILIDKAIQECFENPKYAILSSSSRHKYLVARIRRISRRSIDILTKHLARGKFNLAESEMSFSEADKLDAFTFKLSDGKIMKLTGKIDRIDTYEDTENGKLYIKVIDYKSGNKSFDLVEVYRGLSLQLVVYLNAATELTKKKIKGSDTEIIPAGILYYHIDDPIVEGERTETDEEIEDKILKALKMKGLVNSDEEIFSLIDSKIDSSSDIIPISKTQSGISKRSSAASTAEFEVISEYVDKKICDLGNEIMSGNIKAEPHTAKGIDKDGCKYCPYRDICKYDLFPSDEGSEGAGETTPSGEAEITGDNVIDKMKEDITDGRD